MSEYEQTLEQTEQLEDLELTYHDVLADLWKRIMFCIIGWAIACIGFVIMDFNTFVSLIFLLVGVIIVEIPCFKILLIGGGIGAFFASTFKDQEVIVKYNDGRTERYIESAAGERTMVRFLTWGITLFVGIIATVVNIFKKFGQLRQMQDKENPPKDWKEKPFAPIVVGLGAFVLGILLSGLTSSVVAAIIFNKDDYSDSEKIELIDKLLTDMATVDFAFNDGEYLLVEHDGKDDSYYVKVNETAKSDFKLSALEFIRKDGTWYKCNMEEKTFGAAASDAESKELNKFTAKELIGYSAITDKMKDVTVRDDDASLFFGLDAEKEQILTFHNKDGINKDNLLEVVFGIQTKGNLASGKNIIYKIKYPYSFIQTETTLLFSYPSVNLSKFTAE